jgi:hypothetical protein
MMDNDVISFTKLGTVKSKDFGEFTYETFFDRMIELINRDVVNNQIIHEKNEKRYKIIYKGNTYKVTYGEEPLKEDCKRKDIVNSLNRLSDLSSDLKRIHDDETEREKIERDNLRRVIFNAKQGIFVNNDDKRVYIDYLKKEDKKNSFFGRLFVKIIDNLTYNNNYNPDFGEKRIAISAGVTIFSLMFLGILDSSIPTIAFSNSQIIWISSILCSDLIYGAISLAIENHSWKITMRGKFAGPYAIIWALLNLPLNIIKTSVEKIREKNTIKSLESSLSHSKKDKSKALQVSKQKVQELQKELFNGGKKEEKPKDQAAIVVDKTSREFERLSQKVKGIENSSKRSDYSKELVGIIRDYMKKSEQFFINGVDLVYQRSVENDLKTFESKINMILEDEEKKRQTQREFDQVNDAIEQTINYRASGK